MSADPGTICRLRESVVRDGLPGVSAHARPAQNQAAHSAASRRRTPQAVSGLVRDRRVGAAHHGRAGRQRAVRGYPHHHWRRRRLRRADPPANTCPISPASTFTTIARSLAYSPESFKMIGWASRVHAGVVCGELPTAELGFGHVWPASMFGSVMPFEPLSGAVRGRRRPSGARPPYACSDCLRPT